MDTCTRGYIECMLWATTANGDGIPEDNDKSLDSLGYTGQHLTHETAALVLSDCEEFQKENRPDLDLVIEAGWTAERMGHDFWLTRERHGAGFWDEYYGPDEDLRAAFKRLTDAAHAYGEFGLYVADGLVRAA